MCHIFSSPRIANCIFINNIGSRGGGLYIQNANPILINCLFSANSAALGGGICNVSSSPVIFNCLFNGNISTYGGGICNLSTSAPHISNCTFSGNNIAYSNGYGGGICNLSSSPTIANCIIWGNSDGIYDYSSSTIVVYSIIQGGYIGTGNLNSDPLFADALSFTTAPFLEGDYTLKKSSPAINAGNNSAYNTGSGNLSADKDLSGNPRLYGGIIDMGAYEYQGENTTPLHLLHFTVIQQGKAALLQWRTTAEQNTRDFDLERSLDGNNWNTIQTVNAIGSGNNNYDATDADIQSGNTYYYRLKMNDNDRTYKYSEVVHIKINAASSSAKLSVAPNPVTANTLQITFGILSVQTTLRIISIDGKVWLSQTLSAGSDRASIPIPFLPRGNYFAVIGKESVQFVKQ